MAQKFGGKFSPAGGSTAADENPFRGQPATRVSTAARLLYLFPLPLLLAGIGAIGRPFEMLVELGAFAGLMLAAWLTNDGLRAEAEYNARTVAKPPAIPRKIFAATLSGVSVAAACYVGLTSGQIVGSAVTGLVAAAAHILAFGIDPMKKKGLVGQDDYATERVASAVDRAEAIVKDLLDAARRIGDRQLEGRVERLAGAARDVFRTVEADPRDLPRARKFMTVYLTGARDATIKFAELYSRRRDGDARTKFETLLTDLETSFREHREVLMLEDRTDLDVEIEVLQERLEREGVSAR